MADRDNGAKKSSAGNARTRLLPSHINSHLLNALDSLPDGIAIFDENSELIASNSAYREIFSNLSRLHEPGAHFENLLRDQIAAGSYDIDGGEAENWIDSRLNAHKKPGALQRFKMANGQHVQIRCLGTAIGGIVEIHSLSSNPAADDISREKAALFRAMLDHIPAMITLKDPEGRYLLANKGFEEMTGLSAETAIDGTIHDFRLGSGEAEIIAGLDRQVVQTREPVSEEREVMTMTGVKHRDMTKFPVYDSNDELVGVGTFSIDISKRKAVEHQLRQSQKMEAIGQLVGGISHDFNNMLSVILGNLGLLEDEISDDPKLRPLLDAVTGSAERGAELNRQLLAFSRQTPLAPQSIDLNAELPRIYNILRRLLEETIAIELVRGGGLWTCEADAGQLENAVLNLVLNARDAMPEGGSLTIETANARLDDEYAAAQADVTPGQYVMLAITDTGHGMPQDVAERVYDPFFTTKPPGKGTGMGLSMVFGFVKQSKGHIKLYTEVGQGTTFRIYLPRSRRPAEKAAIADTTVEPRARGETVLVVEDDPDLQTLTVNLLRQLGYDVLEARDRDSALAQLRQSSHINLLLTDVVLPGGSNGPAVARDAAQLHPGIRILYMSGYTENAIIHHGRLDEGVILLEKPFRKFQLARKVREALDADDRGQVS